MDALDAIVDALAAELRLEQELGVRTVACDRRLLTALVASTPAPHTPAPPIEHSPNQTIKQSNTPPIPPSPNQTIKQSSPSPTPSSTTLLDFVFLHHAPLSGVAAEIVAKAVAALGKTAATAPVVCEKPFPKAKAYVVLGERTRRKFLPETRGAPGMWVKTAGGRDAVITYSPADDIAVFKTVTEAIVKRKQSLWQTMKAAQQRTAGR